MTAANIGAEMINGLVRGYMMRKGIDKDEADQAFQQQQRDQQRAEWDRANQERTQLTAAAAPVSVEEGANGAIKPDTMDNSDVGQPGEAPVPQNGGFAVQGKTFTDRASADAAAAAANAPDAIAARQAAAYRSIGKPVEAAQLESATTQAKAAKFTLDSAQQKKLNEDFDRKLSSVGDATQLAGVIDGSPMVQGKKVTAAPSADGKTVDLIVHNDDGTTVKLNNQSIENTPEGVKKAITTYSQSMSPAEKITAMQHFETFAETKRHNVVDEQHAADQLAETTRHSRVAEQQGSAQLGISAGHLSVAQQQLQLAKDKQENDKKNDPDYVLPAATKLQVKGLDKAIELRESALLKAQGDPMFDPNSKGISDIRVQLARLQEQRDAAIKPYLPAAAAPATGKPADPYGLRASLAAKGVAPAPAPAPAAPAQSRAAAGMGAAAAPVAAPAPAQPAADPLLHALGADGNSSVAQVVAQKAPVIRQAADAVRTAQAQVAAAARTGDPRAVQQAMAQAQAAGTQLDAMLNDYMPQQAKAIRTAVGL